MIAYFTIDILQNEISSVFPAPTTLADQLRRARIYLQWHCLYTSSHRASYSTHVGGSFHSALQQILIFTTFIP